MSEHSAATIREALGTLDKCFGTTRSETLATLRGSRSNPTLPTLLRLWCRSGPAIAVQSPDPLGTHRRLRKFRALRRICDGVGRSLSYDRAVKLANALLAACDSDESFWYTAILTKSSDLDVTYEGLASIWPEVFQLDDGIPVEGYRHAGLMQARPAGKSTYDFTSDLVYVEPRRRGFRSLIVADTLSGRAYLSSESTGKYWRFGSIFESEILRVVGRLHLTQVVLDSLLTSNDTKTLAKLVASGAPAADGAKSCYLYVSDWLPLDSYMSGVWDMPYASETSSVYSSRRAALADSFLRSGKLHYLRIEESRRVYSARSLANAHAANIRKGHKGTYIRLGSSGYVLGRTGNIRRM